MPHTQRASGVELEIDRPTCRLCGSAMWLLHISQQSGLGEENQTFECPVCEVSKGNDEAEAG